MRSPEGGRGPAVTDVFGRFHETPNAYVAGPALFPQAGSPNPMLTGVALARRTAEFLAGEASSSDSRAFGAPCMARTT